MSIKSRVESLEKRAGTRRIPGKKPTFREWLAAEMNVPVSEIDPSIRALRDVNKSNQLGSLTNG